MEEVNSSNRMQKAAKGNIKAGKETRGGNYVKCGRHEKEEGERWEEEGRGSVIVWDSITV